MPGQLQPSRDPRHSAVDALGDSARQENFSGRQLVFHAVAAEEVARWLESGPGGLSGGEAARRLTRFGPNELARNPPPSRWWLFLGQFRSAVVWLLIAAALISGALGEWADTAAILAIVLLNGTLGFLQEDKSRRALEALRDLGVPLARVVRDGQLQNIAARELVPGDRLRLEAGDLIAADARLLDTVRFAVQEAALTGESSAVDKEAQARLDERTPLAERSNMVYRGTTVATGKAEAVVAATGMQTELGRIAGLLESQTREPTPLERRLDELGKVLMGVCLVIVVIIFALQIWRGDEWTQVFLISVSLAVAAVPEGLPAVVTLALALGLERMIKRNALIRKLHSVETLGAVTVICSDKTGTLTRNEMTVREVVTPAGMYRATGVGYEPGGHFLKLPSIGAEDGQPIDARGDSGLIAALTAAARCTTARVQPPARPGESWKVIGDPTEAALIVAARKAGLDWSDPAADVVHEIPFDSDRKAMSVVVADGQAQRMFTKGAPEVILARASHELVDGQARPLDDPRRAQLLGLAHEMAGRAMRVLAVATRDFPTTHEGPYPEEELTFVGLAGMLDPPREEAREAVARCRRAGIRPIMITGDHPATAAAIARELGLDGSRVITAHELDAASAAELARQVEKVSVYARVTAEHKQRIVHALKQSGEIVAMTGDGVNDAPAVAAADIGIAMGISGTDVTKAASDMVLTDDNFASIVNAVEEGRGIFDNIQKVVQFLLSTNAGEVLFMFVAVLAGWPAPLLPIQLLWINLITDGLPALTLGMERPDRDVMSRPPRPPREGVLTAARGGRIAAYGALFALCMTVGYVTMRWWAGASAEDARTVAFCVACYSQMFFAFACRSEGRTLPQLGPFSNPALLAAIFVSALLQLTTVLTPWGRTIFQTTPVTLEHVALVVVLSLVPVTVVESFKFLPRPRAGAQRNT